MKRKRALGRREGERERGRELGSIYNGRQGVIRKEREEN